MIQVDELISLKDDHYILKIVLILVTQLFSHNHLTLEAIFHNI